MKKIPLFLALFALSAPAFADAPAADLPANEIEFGLGATALSRNGAGNSAALTFGSGVDTAVGINAAYSRAFCEWFQGTGEGDFYTQSSNSLFFLRVGPTLNLPVDSTGLRNAAYFKALAGISMIHVGAGTANSTRTNFAYKLELGKRFQLFSAFEWKPAFNMTGFTATGQNPLFAFVPAQFSVVF